MKNCFVIIILALTVIGCDESKSCRVTSYGSEYLTYSGDDKLFSNACQAVIRELGYKEKLDDNRTSYPYYVAGNRRDNNQEGELIASSSYIKTKDSEGYEYSIKTIKLSGKDPLVIIETTNPDKFILFNTLCKELNRVGLKVQSQR